jgi:hypothetical protein
LTRATDELKAVAAQLLEFETGPETAPSRRGESLARVIDKLRDALTSLAGAAGFHALLSRALMLASNDVDWLRELRVTADRSLDGHDRVPAVTPVEIARGEVALVATVLTLLTTFIGPALTIRVLKDVWPGQRFGSLPTLPENAND